MSNGRERRGRPSRGLFYAPLHRRFFLVLTILLAVVVPLLLSGIIGAAFRRLFPGLGAMGTFLLLAASLIGSYVNIPLTKLKAEYTSLSFRYVTVFGVTYPTPAFRVGTRDTLLAINLGGAIIPVATSIYLMTRATPIILEILAATLFVTIVVKTVSRPVKGLGIIVPILIPPLSAALPAIFLGGEYSPVIAYAAGTLGTLIGADLLNLGVIPRLGSAMVSLGGAGTFDGIFLAGIMAVLIAS